MASAVLPAQRRLEGKVAIITGGASGIGARAVHLFHENGAKVVIADIQDDLGQSLAGKLGENVSYVHCDVTIEEEVVNLVDAAVSKHGKLDVMFNNAGVYDQPFASILEARKSELERMLGVNLVGGFLGAKHAARVMIPNRKGCIIFTGSVCTSIAGIGSHCYAATKSGVLGLVRNLTPELGRFGVRINCVSPYAVVTEEAVKDRDEREKMKLMMSEIGSLKGQVLEADDVARAALYLASDEASYVSGLNLVVDGGFSVVNPSFMQAFAQLGFE